MALTPDEQLALLESGGDVVFRHLSIGERPVVFAAQVNADLVIEDESGAYFQFFWKNVDPDYDAVDTARGMTVEIGTAPGLADVGRVRLRAPLDTVHDRVQVNMTTPGELEVRDNHYFTVRKEYLPWRIPPRNTPIYTGDVITDFTEYQDYDVLYSDQNVNIPPKANIVDSKVSGQWVPVRRSGWCDAGEDYRTVRLSALASVAMKVGATITGYSWALDGGTLVSGYNATDQVILAEFPAGHHIVTLTVTDSAGKSSVMHYSIWAHHKTLYPPKTSFHVMDDQTRLVGRNLTLEAFGADDEWGSAVIDKYQECNYWEEAFFTDGAPDPSTAGYRDQAVGWVTEIVPLLQLETSRLKIKIGSIGTLLSSDESVPYSLLDTGSTPTSWQEVTQWTIDRGIRYVLARTSTTLDICNVFFTGVTATTPSLIIGRASIWSTISKLAKSAWMSQTGVDSFGSIHCRLHYSYLQAEDRPARQRRAAFSGRYWKHAQGLELPTIFLPQIGAVEMGGAIPQLPEPVVFASRAPGRTRGRGVGTDTAPYQYLPVNYPQYKLDWLAGHHFAWLNNPRKDVTVQLIGNLDIFDPALNEPISITWLETTVHGVALNNGLFLVNSVSIQHGKTLKDVPKTITLQLEQVTLGNQGQSVPIKQRVGLSQPGYTLPPIARIAPWTNDVPINGWVLNSVEAKASKMTAFDETGGTFTYSDMSTGLSGAGIDGYSNPFHYKQAYALMSVGLYTEPNIDAPTSWAQVKSNTGLFGSSGRVGHKARGSHMRDGWGMIVSGENVAVVTKNNWVTVSVHSINGSGLVYGTGGGNDKWCDFCICGHDIDHVIALAPSIVHGGTWAALWRSTDGGLTWALLVDFPGLIDTNYGDVDRSWVEVPYNRLDGSPNVDDSNLEVWIYSTGDINSGQVGRLAVLGGAGTTVLAATTFAFTDNGSVAVHPMTTFTHNSSYSCYIAARYVKRTEDGFGTSTSNLYDMGNGAPNTTSINGWSMNPDVFLAYSSAGGGGAPVIRLSLDGGLTTFGSLPPGWASNAGAAYAELSLYSYMPD